MPEADTQDVAMVGLGSEQVEREKLKTWRQRDQDVEKKLIGLSFQAAKRYVTERTEKYMATAREL